MRPQFAAILFDLDGVVIDSEPLHEEALLQAFQRHGIDLDPAVLATMKGRTDLDVVLEFVAGGYGTPDEVAAILALKHELYHRMLSGVRLVEGADRFLHAAARCVPLALTTSAVRASQRMVFRQFGFDPLFRAVVTAEDITCAKPDPEPYLLTARRLGLPPSSCLVIEDSINGIRSGVGAGCFVVALPTSFERGALVAAGAHHLADSYASLAEWLGIPLDEGPPR